MLCNNEKDNWISKFKIKRVDVELNWKSLFLGLFVWKIISVYKELILHIFPIVLYKNVLASNKMINESVFEVRLCYK